MYFGHPPPPRAAWQLDHRPVPSFRSGAGATGAIAAVLFAIAAARMFLGGRLTALSAPLLFDAYPFLAIALLSWAWAHLRS